jgi:hypothetical protein
MSDQFAGQADLPRSAYLDHTLRRARNAAEQRSHRYVTLEHLLLALLDDPDATRLMQGVGADIAVIRSTVADAVNNRMAALVVPDGRSPNFSYKFDSLFAVASEDAHRLGLREVDGGVAIVAIAKDPESMAAAVLAANGFNTLAALQALSTPPQLRPLPPKSMEIQGAPRPEPAARGPQPNLTNGAPPRSPTSQEIPDLTAGGGSMEDMMASVRNILEAEERKERRLPPKDLAPERRVEPKLRGNGSALKPGERKAAKSRPEPSLGRAQPEQSLSYGGAPGVGGFAEAPAPAFALDQPPTKAETRTAPAGNAPRGKVGSAALLAKILEQVPRKARIAVPETVEFLLSKEEAGFVFGWLSRRGQPQQAADAACRAITIRLSAPDGGFFIEGLTPETQWLLDRPAFLGEETFGTWAWTVIPSDSGSYILNVSMSARGVDANGVAADINLPDQAIKVQVRGNVWRVAGRLLGTALLFLAGSGLTVAAWYVLKIMGKLPQTS